MWHWLVDNNVIPPPFIHNQTILVIIWQYLIYSYNTSHYNVSYSTQFNFCYQLQCIFHEMIEKRASFLCSKRPSTIDALLQYYACFHYPKTTAASIFDEEQCSGSFLTRFWWTCWKSARKQAATHCTSQHLNTVDSFFAIKALIRYSLQYRSLYDTANLLLYVTTYLNFVSANKKIAIWTWQCFISITICRGGGMY